MKTWKQHKTASTVPRQSMFRPMQNSQRADVPKPFFTAAPHPILQPLTVNQPMVQRQEAEGAKPEEKDPLVEGLKTTGEQLLEYPKFKTWFETRLEDLKKRFWEQRPSDEQIAIGTFGGMNLALAGLVFALNPQIREWLSDVNVGKPLGWIPYSPIAGFKYKLPEAGKSTYGFSSDFTFSPYLDALRKRYPGVPLTGASFGLDTAYTAGRGMSVTGGRFGLEFLGGGVKAEGTSFTELSPYPRFQPAPGPFQSPLTQMQSFPSAPPLKTGPGFQVMLSADLTKLFPGLANVLQ